MIPDEIKARFLHEYIKSSNLEALRNEIAAGLRGPAGPPPDFRVHMIAALETVAADIWDQGWRAGSLDVTHRYAPETPNPYLDTEAE